MKIEPTEVLLVHPPLISDMRYGKLSQHGPNTMPFGLAYMAAVLEKNGITVDIYDSMALNHTVNQTVENIQKSRATIIGISFMTPMFTVVKELSRKIKSTMPDCFLVFGGAHPTILPEQTLTDFPWADVLVLGEGEDTFPELVMGVKAKKDLKNIRGIALRDGNQIIITEKRPVIKNLDALPLPAWHLLPMDIYRPTTSRFRRLPSHCILTSRGCPMKCIFCSQTIGRQVRFKSAERVMEETEILVKKYKAEELIIYDSCFTLNRNHVQKICEEMIRRKLNKKIQWSCETRVDLVDKKLLKQIKYAGCWGIHYGVESGSQRILDLMKKNITKERIRDVFKWSHEAGLHTSAFFMLGLPTETKEESQKTIDFAKELSPNFAQFTITVPFPGTPLYDLALESGYFRADDWDGYSTWAGWTGKTLIYVPQGRTSEEMIHFQKKAMTDFFFQPRILSESLLRAVKYPQLLKRYLSGFITLLGEYKKINS